MKVKFDLKLTDYSEIVLRGTKRQRAIKAVSDYLQEQILTDVGNQKSPVTGRTFKALSKDYAAEKLEEVGNKLPNLEKEGDLLDSLTAKEFRGGIRVTVADSQQPKADNHNKFSDAAKATKVPARKFIPNADDGEDFRPEIRNTIKRIIEDIANESED